MRRLALLARLSAVVVVVGLLLPEDARAGWPPPPNATSKDLADPANWPNDPSYAFSQTSSGQWNLYSFIPSTATAVRPEETASGMSVDLAWRQTIGADQVHLAVLDSGIDWAEQDLIERVVLNPKELQNHKPLHADSSACGVLGRLRGSTATGTGSSPSATTRRPRY